MACTFATMAVELSMSCWLLAACRARGVQVVMRNHHLRDDSPVSQYMDQQR